MYSEKDKDEHADFGKKNTKTRNKREKIKLQVSVQLLNLVRE